MINLVIDTGNSSSKVALFDNRKLIRIHVYPDLDENDLKQFLWDTKVQHAIHSSVGLEKPGLERFLEAGFTYIRFHTGINTGISIRYKTPETLGPDRLAAVIGALALYPGKDVLVIDAGTCITYDTADRNKNYYGGSISPGIKMRFEAMHTFTKKLPLIEQDARFNETWGNDTRTAILSGVQQGILHEMGGFIRSAMEQYDKLQVVMCGGDVNFFETRLKSSIFAHSLKTEPDLVLIGLNEVIFHAND